MIVYLSKRNEYVIARRAKPDVAISWYDLHDFDPLRNELRQKTAMLQHPARLLKLLPGDCHGPLGLAMTRFLGTYSNPLNNHLPH